MQFYSGTICKEVADDEIANDELANDEVPSSVTTEKPMADEVDVGDLMLTKAQYDSLYSDKAFKRHGLAQAVRHWPNATMHVKFDPEAKFPADFKERVKSAMEYIMSVSCIKFVWNKEPKGNFVLIKREEKCSSMVN